MEINDIKSLRISLASPEKIREWSYGEVTKPETINYRRLRPEKDGLFCEAIFGPTKDWQCYCGKYKKVRFRGIKCDKCGVEVTHSRVRRERMGHIELATPIAHIWYTRRSPSYLGLLLNISQRNLDRVLYYAQYIITEVDEAARERAMRRLEEEMNREVSRLTKEQQEELDAIDAELAERAEAAATQEQELTEDIQRRRDEAVEAVMSEATRLRELLESHRDQPAPDDIVLKPSETLILPQGDVIRREHLSAFNKIVQDELSRLEEQFSLERDRVLAPLDTQEEQASRQADAQQESLREDLDRQLEEIRTRYEQQMEELMSLRPRQLLNETRYRELREKWGRVFSAGMGAEAVYDIVSQIDLDKMAEELRHEIRTTGSKQRRKKATKRLQIVEALRRSGNRPEWMILQALPVIPPALRPMVQLDGGRFATSDLNDLYRRVVNRNNRLKHLIKLQAPEVIVRNEKRMLQEAVDALIDNSRRGKMVSLRGRRQLKSLSDMLKGKQGRFRRNLLGKRVDYSGRSVIVVGPKLKLHQCGLPKRMALELFRPFVMQKLVEYNHAINVKGAKRLIEREVPEVWEVLEEVIKTRPVLVNRAPTLHRLGIQAFEPVLVEGSAIQIHPLVCSAFNADFDGDQMAVHVPLSDAAVREARELMLSSRNLLRPANGEPEVGPAKDMVLGCYYLSLERDGMKGEGMAFSSFEEVELAYQLGKVHPHAKIKVYYQPKRGKAEIIDTTVGRVLFNTVLPEELRFVNEVLDKGALKRLVAEGYRRLGLEGTAELVDAIKDIGFKFAMLSGTTIAIDDIQVPEEKARILDDVNARVTEVERQYRRGLITDNERYVKTVELWTEATEEVTSAVARQLDPYSSLGIMANSGATKGGIQPIRQLAGMRGLMAADPSGRIIALPIQSNFREGLSALEYFLSTHGARKGLADTALRTADAGYLTRRLVDVAQDVIIHEEDCGTTQGIWVTARGAQEASEPFTERIAGRYAAAPVVHPQTGEILCEANEAIDDDLARQIEEAGVQKVNIRSPLTCTLRHGLCVRCYGRDLGRGTEVKIGEAVGIIAAQSIGEPGTQLTLRTFHTGGVAGTSDITQGLPRVQELFEARNPRGQAIIADISGRVELRSEGDQRWVRIVATDVRRVPHHVPGNFAIDVVDGDEVDEGAVLAHRKGEDDIVATTSGRVSIEEDALYVIREEREEREYEIPVTARLRVIDGMMINAGDMITEGPKNPHEILSILGVEAVREYLVIEIQRVYRSQGVSINDKHIEVIVRQMLRRVRITSSGDTELLPGQLVDSIDLEEMNQEIIAQGGEPAVAEPILLGITKAALNTDSFLSAASFQHTISVLASAAIEGKVDELRGLKESVIIGKLIPAGTGFRTDEDGRAQQEMVPAGEGHEELAEIDTALLEEFGDELFAGGLTTDLSVDLEAEVDLEGLDLDSDEFDQDGSDSDEE
ncbi:MAG TPA: DNA-directed RNA polymerase subunit beta' [Chloroflexi bacterium]|nr:DNA-directed RNA polymerase subunit beta' [Chloroflexota bacterium]